MMSEQEALVPLLMAELRSQLAKRAPVQIRAEGGDFVVSQGMAVAHVPIPHIDDVCAQAKILADHVETTLTLRV